MPQSPNGRKGFFYSQNMEKFNLTFCKHCDCETPYRTEMKSGQNTAWCLNCTRFIKNMPAVRNEEKKDFVFYFGKYRDTKLSDFNTPQMISWLRWVLNTNSVKPWQKELITKHIND